MFRLNNKGFAITTVLYGLSVVGILLVALLMATMASIRRNSSDLVKSIERELNSVGKAEIVFSPLTDASGVPLEQEYSIPRNQSGFYKIELWGSQGGGNSGGFGAYVSGIIYLKEGSRIFLYVGDHQTSSGGGYSTDVRWKRGTYTNVESAKARIMVAAGGGAGIRASGGSLKGYVSTMNLIGGTVDVNGTYPSYGMVDSATSLSGSVYNASGSVVAYNESGSISQNPASGPSFNTNNGGYGYYSSNSAGAGGVSYILGYAGSKTYNGVEIYPSSFLDGQMYPGVHQGAGKAKITKISDSDNSNELKRNAILKDTYQYVKDCVANGTTFDAVIMSGGAEVPYTKTVSGTCATYNLGSLKSIDEIAVWHGLAGKDVRDHKLSVSKNGSTWYYLINAVNLSETETVTGIRVSAYQNATRNKSNNTLALPNGDYYIIPVTANNKAITVASTAAEASNALSINYLDGLNTQKWKIEQVGEAGKNEYRIIELARYKAMAIGILTNTGNTQVVSTDENVAKNYIRAFNSYEGSPAQIWGIYPQPDGTYTIKTTVSPLVVNSGTGTIMTVPNGAAEFINKAIIARENVVTQRYKLVAVSYGKSVPEQVLTVGNVSCAPGGYLVSSYLTCSVCPKGSYSGAGAAACTACNDGYTTTYAGQGSCNTKCAYYDGTSKWATATWVSATNKVSNLCVSTACKGHYYLSSGRCIACFDGECEVDVYDKKRKRRRKKKIKDLTEDDYILCWNFDECKFDYAKVLWLKQAEAVDSFYLITFSDGSVLKVIGAHRLFDVDSQEFLKIGNVMEMGIGSHVYNDKGEIVTITSCERIELNCLSYNVITDKHVNVFVNGILTSCAFSNIFKIKDMKYLDSEEECLTLDDLDGIPEKYITGLRLTNVPCSFENGRKETSDMVKDYVKNLMDHEKK